ncbi:hypothetical protein, partial [Hyphomicrobium sp. 2TAF46]|uniref:hypothetical protein n=1 Tax=Hyphomicrobium sp. 2TAF46 TaxID=3233019 RepID=UPI003F93A178
MPSDKARRNQVRHDIRTPKVGFSSLGGEALRRALWAGTSAAALALASPGAAANPLASGNNLPTPSAAAIAAAQSGQQEAARAARAAQNVL